jgi:glycosyltransferase involved in cell wall biosynthesis
MKMALFFTRGMSLKTWIETGLIDREKSIYEEHIKKGDLTIIYWFTYGNEDKHYARELKKNGFLDHNIEVIRMPRFFNINKIGSWLYSLCLPFLKRDILKQCDIYKTNQMEGSWSAVIAKYLYNKPLLLRTGYTKSILIKTLTNSKLKMKFYENLERFVFNKCDMIIVTNRHDKMYIHDKYRIHPNKVKVLYNYIDIDKFKPINNDKYEHKVVFVGRIHHEKNLINLIKSIATTELTLDIYGNGELEGNLKILAKELNIKVNFMGVVPNNKLPQILNKYRYYVISSFYEGMPKTLLEAMACGVICIGTDVKGINEIIEDGVTGYLSNGTGSKDISLAIQRALKGDNEKIITNGVRKIRDHFSLETISNMEIKIIKSLVQC